MAMGKGRDGRREARWRSIVREHVRSGLGVREFCRRGKLTETAFYFWRGELQRRQVEGSTWREGHLSGVALAKPEEQREAIEPPPKPAFVAVRVDEQVASPAGGRMEIELPGGRRVHVAPPVDRQGLADVLAVLRLDEAAARSELEAQRC
jgi:hypothetical protein